MRDIRTAVILAAGAGSRLQARAPSKPLFPVGGKPLVDWAVDGLAEAGIERVILVTGYGAHRIEAHLRGRDWPVPVETVESQDWRLPNGVSVRSAAPLLAGAPALLTMCDHLVHPSLYRRVRTAGAGEGLTLGIDRRLGHPWVDPADVTCVRTEGERIVAIGKGLEPHDCYDTGVFAMGPALFEALEADEAPSLTDGVRALAAKGHALTVDCSDLDWIDVDDPEAAAKAEQAVLNGCFLTQ